MSEPTLWPGARLGPYEVESLLGAGGMGEVYRARDTRLSRIVALKVLPAALSADAARRQRFHDEARAISALNHPHIRALYDVGADGFLRIGTIAGIGAFISTQHVAYSTMA